MRASNWGQFPGERAPMPAGMAPRPLEAYEPPPELGPPALNIDTAIALSRGLVLHYRTMRFRIPPVPARIGYRLIKLEARLLELRHRVHQRAAGVVVGDDEAEEREVGEFLAFLEEATSLMWALTEPTAWSDRLLKRLRPRWWARQNPFVDADEAELSDLFGTFCWYRRKASSLRIEMEHPVGRS